MRSYRSFFRRKKRPTITGDVKSGGNINVQSPFNEETTNVGVSWLAYGTLSQTGMWWSVQFGFANNTQAVVNTDNIAAGLSVYCVVADPVTGKTTVYRNETQLYQYQACIE